jgi:hypothetical protein
MIVDIATRSNARRVSRFRPNIIDFEMEVMSSGFTTKSIVGRDGRDCVTGCQYCWVALQER